MTKSKPDLPPNEEAVPNDPSVKDLLAMMIAMRKEDQKLQQESLRQTRKRSNAVGPDRSIFNPRGQKDYPMPDLEFAEVLMPWPLRRGFMHGMDREEIELMNRVRPGEYTLDLLDGTTVACCVIGTKNTITGKIERLAFMGPKDEESGHYSTLYTRELRAAFPSLKAQLRQILDQQGVEYADILTMKEEHRRIALPEDDPKHLAVSLGE